MRAQKTEIRAFVRVSPGHPEGRQVAAVIAAGATHVYVEGEARAEREVDGARVLRVPDARRLWLISLRNGDVGMVATPGRLASRYQEIGATLTELHRRGACVIDAETGRRSDELAHTAGWITDAISEIRGERGKPFTSESGKEAAAKTRRPGKARLPKAEARAIWRDLARHPRNVDALRAMPGWSLGDAYRAFGRRHADGSHGGRPRKQQQ
jgi:hypothetical protein